MGQDSGRHFPTTHWGLIESAGDDDDAVRQAALDAVLRKYIPPMRAYLAKRRGLKDEQIDDLLQEFIVRKVLVYQLFTRADRRRGHFRSFLVTALDRFVASELRDAAHRKGVPFESIPEPPHGTEAKRHFEMAWARQLLDQAIDNTHAECTASNRQDIWDVFKSRVVDPSLKGDEPAPYALLAEKYDGTSPQNLLVTGKRMFIRNLRALIGEYEMTEEGIDAELADLRMAVTKADEE
jgi:hypothetical protein